MTTRVTINTEISERGLHFGVYQAIRWQSVTTVPVLLYVNDIESYSTSLENQCLKQLPPEDGWTNHSASLYKVPIDLMEKALAMRDETLGRPA